MDIDNKIQPSKKKFKLHKKKDWRIKMNAHKRYKIMKIEAIRKRIEAQKGSLVISEEKPEVKKVEEKRKETPKPVEEKKEEKPAEQTATPKFQNKL